MKREYVTPHLQVPSTSAATFNIAAAILAIREIDEYERFRRARDVTPRPAGLIEAPHAP